jgi:hypothetical protein
MFICGLNHFSPVFLDDYVHSSVGRDSSVDVATGYGLDITSRWGRDFSHTFIPALGPTQPPIQWVPGLSRGKAVGAWCWPPPPPGGGLRVCYGVLLPFNVLRIRCSKKVAEWRHDVSSYLSPIANDKSSEAAGIMTTFVFGMVVKTTTNSVLTFRNRASYI